MNRFDAATAEGERVAEPLDAGVRADVRDDERVMRHLERHLIPCRDPKR